ncbi:hypothetical protein PS6_010881 [Mucor atramentarius]
MGHSSDNQERKIIVAIDYDCDLEIEEVLDIIKEYMYKEEYQTHNIDEGKYYVNLKDMDDATWERFTTEWCDARTKSGYVLQKYDDWRLCALPIGWWSDFPE